MKITSAYDAWKNFILVIAGVLAGEMLSSFGEPNSFSQNVQSAVLWLLDFDKVVSKDMRDWGLLSVITTLTVIYFIKCMHGMIVGIFSEDYQRHLQGGVAIAMLSCTLATLSIVSLTFVPWLARQVQAQTTVEHTAWCLMAMATLPLWFVLPFDIWRMIRDDRELSIKGMFSRKKQFGDVVDTWILEDAISIASLAILAALLAIDLSNETKIYLTLITLIFYLIINSVFDYVVNRSFFFDFKVPPTRRSTTPKPADPPVVPPLPA